MFDFIARPLGQFLLLLYDLTGNYGFALILFAVAVKIVLLPFQMKSKKGTMRQARLQPKLQDIQKRYASNKAKVNEEMQKLYKEEGVNPASGCLWGFLPLPIMFALFQAIRQPLTMMMSIPREMLQEGGAIYNRLVNEGFVPQMQAFYLEMEQAQFISSHFDQFVQFVSDGLRQLSFQFGPANLGLQPQWNFFWHEDTDWSHTEGWVPGLLLFLLPVLSCGMQFISQALIRKYQPQMPQQEGAGKSMQTMMMLMPLISGYFGFILPAALSVYWTVGTILQIFQDLWLNKRYTRILDLEDEERNRLRAIKEAEIEAKKQETERKRAEGIVEENKNKSKRKKQKGERQEKLEKTAEWEKKHAPPKEDKKEEYEPSRVGNRRHARGRAYDPYRYSGAEGAASGEQASASEDSSEDSIAETENPEFEIENSESEGGAVNGGIQDAEDEPDDDADEEDDEDDIEDGVEDGTEDGIGGGDSDEPDVSDTTETVRFDTARFDENKD